MRSTGVHPFHNRLPGFLGTAVTLRVFAAILVGLSGGCDGDRDHDGLIAVRIKEKIFRLELAADATTRMQGLSDRTRIAPDGGMLFVFERERVASMVMRRCHVPIDVIFLDAHARVVRTHRMAVEPDPLAEDFRLRRYSSGDPVLMAIELAAGSLDRLDITLGDRIDLDVPRLRALAAPPF